MNTLEKSQSDRRKPDLRHRIELILEEARMVLPGIQALLGFQFVAFFNQGFSQLTYVEQFIHLSAVLCSLTSIALLLTPAALHRVGTSDYISKELAHISGRLVALGMIPLMVSVSLDWFVVVDIVFRNAVMSAISAAMVFSGFFALWVVWPRLRERHISSTTVDYV